MLLQHIYSGKTLFLLTKILHSHSPSPILHHLDGDFFGWSHAISQYLWPLDQCYRILVFEDLCASYRGKSIVLLKTIEIKMIYIFSVFLIVGIGW